MEVKLIVVLFSFMLLRTGVVKAISIQAVDQSCVLSLVVPRDKIKTSCSVDDVLTRRLNTMETKINIYKQQVLELETQIHKERLLNNDKIWSLETMLSKVDKLEELDKRLSYVESLQQRDLNNQIPKSTNVKYLSENDNFIPSDQSLDTTSYQWKKYTRPVEDKIFSEEKLKLLEKLQNMKNNINEAGNNIVHKVEDVLKNVTDNVNLNKTFTSYLDDVSEGENGSAFEENSNQIQNDQPTKISKLTNTHLANDTDSSENIDRNLTEKAETSIESNSIPSGRNFLVIQLEEMLKIEIEKVLNDQMEEVISLVSKQSETIEDAQNGQIDSINILSDQHLSDIKYLNDKIASIELSMKSLTQTMQTMYSKTDKMLALPALFEELKKNLTENPPAKFSGRGLSIEEELDEHSKKLRTLERLSAIFKRSLEHYRNESKAAYAEIEQKVFSESTMVKALREGILHNVSTLIDEQINLQNSTIRHKLREMENMKKRMEDQNVLMQVDLDTKSRKLRSKLSKLEHDLKLGKQDIQSIGFSQSNIQKQQEGIVIQLETIGQNTDIRERVEMLELEFKLSLTHDWVEYPFNYDTTRTDCFGLQFVRKTEYINGRYVGVILCTNHRYKIVLAQNLKDKFMNIGDEDGYGEDHCEFVGSNSNNIVKVSNPSLSFTHERGYTRSNWGDKARIVLLDFIRPSPSWYECGVSIP